MAGLKLKEVAERINAHLRRFEGDPKINKRRAHGLTPYYNAASFYSGGAHVGVCYVSFQGTSHLTKADALKYLEMLDGGFVGRHYEALRQAGAR